MTITTDITSAKTFLDGVQNGYSDSNTSQDTTEGQGDITAGDEIYVELNTSQVMLDDPSTEDIERQLQLQAEAANMEVQDDDQVSSLNISNESSENENDEDDGKVTIKIIINVNEKPLRIKIPSDTTEASADEIEFLTDSIYDEERMKVILHNAIIDLINRNVEENGLLYTLKVHGLLKIFLDLVTLDHVKNLYNYL